MKVLLSEQTQIFNNMEKNFGVKSCNMTSKTCHLCSIRTEPENPVSFKLDSGLTIIFCNDDELNQWKSLYDIA